MRVVDDQDVAELEVTRDGRRVSGVRTIGRTVGGVAETLTADLHVAAGRDPVLGRAFLRVVNLIDPPERLMSPELAFRVMRGTRAAG